MKKYNKSISITLILLIMVSSLMPVSIASPIAPMYNNGIVTTATYGNSGDGDETVTSDVYSIMNSDAVFTDWGPLTEEEVQHIQRLYSPKMLQIASYYYPYLARLLTQEQLLEQLAWDDEQVKQLTRQLSASEQELLEQYTPIAVQKIQLEPLTVLNVVYDDPTISVTQDVYGAQEDSVADAVYRQARGLFALAAEEEFVYSPSNIPVPYKVKTDGVIDLVHGTSVQQEVDLYLPGKNGLDLEIVRSYNSLNANTEYFHLKADGSCSYYPEYQPNNPITRTECSHGIRQTPLSHHTNVAHGWTLNIPTLSYTSDSIYYFQTAGLNPNYAYYSRDYQLGETVITLEDGSVYKFKPNESKPYNHPYENVVLQYINQQRILTVNDQVTYRFDRYGIEKSNRYGDRITYTNRLGTLTIKDTMGRTIILSNHYPHSYNGIKQITVTDEAGKTTHNLTYKTVDVKESRTCYDPDYGTSYPCDATIGYALDHVKDELSGKVLQSYTYYNPMEWYADANMEDDYKYTLNGSGNPILDVQVNGQGVESREIDERDRATHQQLRYLLLKEAIDNTGFTTHYTYQSYNANWKNYGSYEERNRNRGTIRKYLDPYMITYQGYHPVANVHFKYTDASGAQKLLTQTVSRSSATSPEVWSDPKSGGVVNNQRLQGSGAYRSGDTVSRTVTTNYGFYTEAVTSDYYLNRTQFVLRQQKHTVDDNAPLQVNRDGVQYTRAVSEIETYQYDHGKTMPYLVKRWSDGVSGDPKPQAIRNFLQNGNSRTLPANLSNYATYEKMEYDAWGYPTLQEDSLGNRTETTYGGIYRQPSRIRTVSGDGQTVIEETREYVASGPAHGKLKKVARNETYPNPDNAAQRVTDTSTAEYGYDNAKTVPVSLTETGQGHQYGRQPTRTVRHFEYDAKNVHVTKETIQAALSPGAAASPIVLSYQYDARDRLIQQTYPDGSEARYRYDTQDRLIQSKFVPASKKLTDTRSTDYLYDDPRRTVTTVSPDGSQVITTYTPYGDIERQRQRSCHPERYSYNGQSDFSSAQWRNQWSYHYDYYYYDDEDETKTSGLMTYNAALGRWEGLSHWSDRSYLTADTAYVVNGNRSIITRQWTAPISGAIRITGTASLIWNNRSRIQINVKKNGSETVWPAQGNATFTNVGESQSMDQTMYVDRGDTIQFNVSGGNGTVRWVPQIQYTYPAPAEMQERTVLNSKTDATGRWIIEKRPYDQDGLKTTYTYGPFGVRTETIAQTLTNRYAYANAAYRPDGSMSHLQRTTRKTETDGKETTTFADPYGRVVKQVEKSPTKERTAVMTYNPLGQMTQKQVTGAGKTQTTKYRYDGSGHLVYLEDDLGQKHTYVYNRLGQIIAQYVNGKLQKETTYNETGWPMTKKNAAGQTETYTYQNNGLVKRYTDKAGQHYNYTYTAQHEEERLSITNASGGEVYWKQNGYDPNSRLLTSTSNSEGNNLSYQYDIWKRLKRQTAAGRNYTFEYDGFDRLQALVYPEGQRVTYGYDNLHRIKSVQYAGMGTVQYGYAIGSNENRYDIQYPNGVRQEKRTDAFKELTSQRSYKGTAADWNETFAHDGMGNISGMNRNGKNHQFQYDGLNRIREENGPDGFTTYTYDDRGNRQTMESSVRPSFAWTSQDLTYNALNQLKTYTNHSNQSASYSYYPDGLRAVKTVNGQTTKYVYYNGRVIEELDGGGNVKARNIWGNELLWRQDNSTGKSGYYVYNGHGDVVAIKDGNGNNLNTYDYDIWGNVHNKTEGMNNPYRYTGEPQDDESGLIYLRARYYDPTIGRFIQQDTYEGDISNPLSLNVYTYVHNNPLRYTDPSGHIIVGPNVGEIWEGFVNIWGDVSTWTSEQYQKYREWKEQRDKDFYEGNISSEELRDIALGSMGALKGPKGLGKFGKTIKEEEGNLNLPKMRIDDNQFGRKVGKHAEDYGLDPKNPDSRQWVRKHIEDIRSNPDEIRSGTWNGLGDGPPNARGRGPAVFYRQGNDVIVTDTQGNFVTILKDGINNTSFKSGEVLK